MRRWFFPNTSRREAERLLEYLDNEPGVFLIRESEQDNGKCWSLSILDYNDEKQRHTKHYRIRKIDSGGCFISTRNRFDSLDELVIFYSSKFFFFLFFIKIKGEKILNNYHNFFSKNSQYCK